MIVQLPKKKPAPRRYTSAAEIEKDIARVHRKIKKLENKAQEELDSESLYRGVDVAECRKHEDAATELLGKIKRLKDTRLKRLGNTLSNFKTKPLGLEGIGEDVILNRV